MLWVLGMNIYACREASYGQHAQCGHRRSNFLPLKSVRQNSLVELFHKLVVSILPISDYSYLREV